MATNESEAFAELLRELKDRSGRSYGVLAGKLHVSTSTLHRYCNGDAVPTDYASVERLARLCGANAEELVELHRRWIVANEARRRARSAASAPGTSASAPDSAAPGSGNRTGTEGDAAAGFASAPASVADTRSPDQARFRIVHLPRTKRLRLLLAAVAVVAVAVPAVAYGMRDAAPIDNRSVGAVVSETPGQEAAGMKSSPSPSPSASSHGKNKESPSPSPSVSLSQKANASPHASINTSSAVPVAVSTRPYAFEDPCSQHYLIDSVPTDVPPPPTEQDAPGWVGALGGVASGSQYIELTVQGTGSETAVLTALNVRIVKSDAPLAWTDYAMGVGCGGGVGTKSFAVNLDAGRPSSEPRSGQRDFPYKVSESDPEVFYISASSKARDVSWYLELVWSSGNRTGTIRVDDHGKPFRTSGSAGRPTYDYPPGGSEWEVAATG